MVDPHFNDTVNYDLNYKKVLIDFYAPFSIELAEMEVNRGIRCLEQTLVTLAETKSKRDYPATHTEYGQSVWDANDLDSSGCWMGYYYLKNESDAIFAMKFKPMLKGCEVIGRPWEAGNTFDLSVAPKEHEMVIYRRF